MSVLTRRLASSSTENALTACLLRVGTCEKATGDSNVAAACLRGERIGPRRGYVRESQRVSGVRQSNLSLGSNDPHRGIRKTGHPAES